MKIVRQQIRGIPLECFLDPAARLEPGARWVNSYTDQYSQHRLREVNAGSDGVGAECDSVCAAFWNATLPTVRDCVTDFETAKSRRGVQACPQPDRTQDNSKLLQTIQMNSPPLLSG